MDEGADEAIRRNAEARETPDDMLDDLPLEVTDNAVWKSTRFPIRFPTPFPWKQIGHISIKGDEATRTEDGSYGCTIWRIQITNGRNGCGYSMQIHVKGANTEGYEYATKVFDIFYQKMPQQIKDNFTRKGYVLIRNTD